MLCIYSLLLSFSNKCKSISVQESVVWCDGHSISRVFQYRLWCADSTKIHMYLPQKFMWYLCCLLELCFWLTPIPVASETFFIYRGYWWGFEASLYKGKWLRVSAGLLKNDNLFWKSTPSKHKVLTKNKNVVVNRLLLMALTLKMHKKNLSM